MRASWARALAHVFIANCLFALNGPIEALADTPPEEEMILTLEPVQVRGQRIENIEDVTQEVQRRPASTILIEEKQIKESLPINMNDVLQFAPGVRFQSRFGADEGQFQIRGTSLRNNFHHRGVNILINGIYFGDADGFSDFESIDLLAYDRIEIYKGANALRYGANSIGGAINFVPRTGYNASPLQTRILGGSYGTYLGQVSSGRVNQPFTLGHMNVGSDYYVSLSGNHQDGFQDNSQQSRARVNANFGFQLGDHQEIRAYLLTSNVAERIPGSLTLSQLENDRTQPNTLGGISPFACNPTQTCKWGRYYNLYRLGVAYRNDFAPHQYFEVIPYYSYQYLDHPIFQTIVQDNSNVGGEIRYGATMPIAGHDNLFVIGLQPRFGNQHQRRFVNNLGNRGNLTQNLFVRTLYLGAYIEDQFQATDKLTLIAGGRLDYTTRQGNEQTFFPPTGAFQNFSDDLRVYSHFSPKVGFLYKTSEKSQVYGNISNAYEAPINVELTGPVNFTGAPKTGTFLDLDAQRAWQFELGTRGTTADRRIRWDVTAYDLEMRKEILAANVLAFGQPFGTFGNANNTRHTGVEAGAVMVLKRGLFVQGGGANDDALQTRFAYTWSRFKFTEDVFKASAGTTVLEAQAGNTVPGMPEHLLAAELRYDHPKGWWIAPNFEWSMTGFYVNNANTAKNPAYFVVHLRSGFDYSKHLTFFAEGRNLTNQTYAGAVVVNDVLNRFYNPAWGLSGFAGVEWRF